MMTMMRTMHAACLQRWRLFLTRKFRMSWGTHSIIMMMRVCLGSRCACSLVFICNTTVAHAHTHSHAQHNPSHARRQRDCFLPFEDQLRPAPTGPGGHVRVYPGICRHPLWSQRTHHTRACPMIRCFGPLVLLNASRLGLMERSKTALSKP